MSLRAIQQEYAYDLDKNLTGLTVHSGDRLLSQTSYTYDGNGNRIRKQALDGTTLYQYDALNQLQRVDYPAYSEELFYDKAGNRARRLMDGEEELYQYDPRNRLMAYTKNGATTPFQYDNAGNLLRDDKAKYTYDAFNRTTKVETFDGNVQVNRYDAEGLRHEMEENGRLVRFIFHKGEAVAEQEENSNVIRLIRGSELIARSSDSESARTYYHYASDEMGSTTHIVDDNGNVQNRYAYDAWGKITVREEAVPNRFTYYGQQIDPITQQYYLRARFYNPVLGRFTQEDTYRGDGLNLYAYCANNPVFYTDPSGRYKDATEAAVRQLTDNKITGPNNTKITVDEDLVRYGGYYTRKEYRRIIQTAQPAEVYKHVKARSESQAQMISSGGGPAQYLPEIDHLALERRAIFEGRLYVDTSKGAVYYYYDAGTIIGYDRGMPVTSIRAELTSGNVKLYHGHPMAEDRMKN